jgi:HAD superfamily hydrolase (TIGR01450 family)
MLQRLREARCFLIDMDGTCYLGDELIAGTLDLVAWIRAEGRGLLFLTNNSSKNSQDYAAKLNRLGVEAAVDEILTSGAAAAGYAARRWPGGRPFVAGTSALGAEFAEQGLLADGREPEFVVLGFDTTLTYNKLWRLCDLVRAGLPYIATHPDPNCVIANGLMPDIGAAIAYVAAATGRQPDVVLGKPSREMGEAAAARAGVPLDQLCIVGDYVPTDIALGATLNIPTVLVLTGETRREHVGAAEPRPDLVCEDVGELAAWLRQGPA